MTELKIKKGFLFLFCLAFFFFPSNNGYAIAQVNYQPPRVQALDLEAPPIADYPVKINEVQVPWLTARATLVVDRDSGVVIFEKNKETQLLPASTVKLMTALVAQEAYSLDQTLRVEKINDLGQDMKLKEGELMSVRNLLYGLLVASANDAAQVLAQSYPGGMRAFIQAMNDKAEALNLTKSYFANPTGLDVNEVDQLVLDTSYSTAFDLGQLARMVLKDPVLGEMVATREIIVSDSQGEIDHYLYNINELLHWLPGIKGVKTGWTEEAGECLIGYVERDNRGLITVVLGSQDRFGETAKLIDWAFANHQWQLVTPAIQPQ